MKSVPCKGSFKKVLLPGLLLSSLVLLMSHSAETLSADRDPASVRVPGNMPKGVKFPPRITSTSPCFRVSGTPGSFEFEINGQFLRDYGPGNNFPTSILVKQGYGHTNPTGASTNNLPILENTNTRIRVRLDPGYETVGIFVQTYSGFAKACDFTFLTKPTVKGFALYRTMDDFNLRRPVPSLPSSGGIVWVWGESLIDPAQPNTRTFTVGGHPNVGGIITSTSMWNFVIQIPPRSQIPNHPDPNLTVKTTCSTCNWIVPLQFGTRYGKSNPIEVRLQR